MTRKLPAFPGLCIAVFLILSCPLRVGAQSAQVPARISLPIDETNLITLHGNTHPLARAEFDQGAAPASLPMKRMLLVLQRNPGQESALEQLLQEQQDNSSPSYHRWLTPQQFGAQFGPAQQDIQSITTWLESHGFQVAGAAKGGMLIEFSGTAGQVQQAFHTAIHKYTVNGEQHYANATNPMVPAGLLPMVAGLRSLNNFPAKPMNYFAGTFHRDRESGKIVPTKPLAIPQFTPGSSFECGILGGPCEAVGPFDLATIYNYLPLWNSTSAIDGTGQTIAIVGETDINPADWSAFWNLFGVTHPKGALNIIHNGPDPGVQGDESEADIDTQWSSAVAKGATIDLVVSETTETTLGVDLSAEYIVDNNLAPVMSESYGICELFIGTAGNTFYNQLWQQASAQGITVFVSSGDQGSAACDREATSAAFGQAVSGFESTPYNVSVGGTDFNDLKTTATYWNPTNSANESNAKGYIPEMTWNNSCTNSELFSFFGATTAEQVCNNSEAQQDGFLIVGGGSGGASNCTASTTISPSSCTGGYAKPAWQNVTGVPADGKRDVPDVSLFASNGFNNSFYIVCQSDVTNVCGLTNENFSGFGGTSVSSPAFAGIMALVDQKTGERQGNANYVFYKMAATAANNCNSGTAPPTGTNSCIFYDIPAGSTIAMPCMTGSPDCTTSTVGHQNGVLSGYAAGNGFDLATGLGSVNVENLVNQWSTYAGQFKGSTFSSFALGPPATITHGQPIAVAATVVPQSGTGTPTGSIVLIGNNGLSASGEQVAQQVFPLSNGSVPAATTTDFLVGGTSYTVTAHYSGDGIFAPSDSLPITVTVNPEASKTLPNLETFDSKGILTSFTATNATYGSGFYLFRVDVGDAAASVNALTGISSNCSKHLESCPAGNITLTANGVPLDGGSLPLNTEGYAENQTLATGAYAISASFPGDPSFKPSTGTANFTIAKASGVAAAAVAGTPVQYGDSDEIAAGLTTTSNGAAPTGTFAFFLDGAPLAVSALTYEGFPYDPTSSPPEFATYDGSGSATFLSLGSHTLSAKYSGDANYAPESSPPATFTVTQALPGFDSWGASPATINLGQPTTLTAQMSGSDAGVPPTGTMTFKDGSTALSGTVTYTPINATALTISVLRATMPYTPTSAGTHSITVTYSGDTNYLPVSVPLAATLTVTGPMFVVTASPSSIVVPNPGGSGAATLTFSGVNGYSGTIPLSPSLCAGMPAETTCSFSAPSAVLSATATSATATVTFNTTAATGATTPSLMRKFPGDFGRLKLGGLLALACIGCMGSLWVGFRSRKTVLGGALTLIAITMVLALTSCGGGTSGGGGGGGAGVGNPGTPVGVDAGVVITFSGAGITPAPTVTLSINVQ
jgi:hypothetical protein